MAGKTRSDASSSTSGGAERGESVVIDCRRQKSSCGYCKSGARTSITHGPINLLNLLNCSSVSAPGSSFSFLILFWDFYWVIL